MVLVIVVVMVAFIFIWKDVLGHELAKQDAFQRLDLFHERHDILHLPMK